jgi:hypothetical protein
VHHVPLVVDRRVGDGRLVEHRVEVVQPAQPGGVDGRRDVRGDDVALEVDQVRPVGGREVVDHDDVMAVGGEPLGEIRPDEPGSAGDKCTHVRLPKTK